MEKSGQAEGDSKIRDKSGLSGGQRKEGPMREGSWAQAEWLG